MTGNYTQTSTGVLTIQFAGHSKGQFDVLSVGGKASLGGTLQLVSLDKFGLAPGRQLQVFDRGRWGNGPASLPPSKNPYGSDTDPESDDSPITIKM